MKSVDAIFFFFFFDSVVVYTSIEIDQTKLGTSIIMMTIRDYYYSLVQFIIIKQLKEIVDESRRNRCL